MTPAEIKARALRVKAARNQVLFKGRLRVDSEGDLVGDSRSGVLGSVQVVASSSPDYVLMEEDAEFFAIAANEAAWMADTIVTLVEALEDCKIAVDTDYIISTAENGDREYWISHEMIDGICSEALEKVGRKDGAE